MRLSSIQKHTLIGTESINSTFTTSAFSLHGFQNGYAAQIDWINGSGPMSMIVKIQASLNGTSFSDITGSEFNITTLSGNNIWDVTDTNLEFIRFVITVTTGQADFTLLLSGKGYH